MAILGIASVGLWGCAGITVANSDSTYSLSGTITPASAGNGVKVTLSGPAAGSTTTNSSGAYSFSGLVNGTYVVTPSRSGYEYDPPSAAITINGTNQANVDFSGVVRSTHSVNLSWRASTSAIVGYNVYRGTSNGGPYTRMNSQLISALSFTDTNVGAGTTYYYVCTSVNAAGEESGDSNQVSVAVP